MFFQRFFFPKLELDVICLIDHMAFTAPKQQLNTAVRGAAEAGIAPRGHP